MRPSYEGEQEGIVARRELTGRWVREVNVAVVEEVVEVETVIQVVEVIEVAEENI